MPSIADLFPPGTDLCQLPAGLPPPGQLPDFNDPGLKSLAISISVILTTICTVFGLGRLHTNFRKFSWTDLFVLGAMAANIANAVVTIIFVKYFRHAWDVPLCWINGEFQQISYVWENLLNFSLFFSKIATLMLFRQLFSISRAMSIAIWVGVVFCFVTYASGVAVTSYYAAPHVGGSWDELAAEAIGTTIFALYWSVIQGSASTVLDVYIFILPLPVLARLNLSMKRKIQVIAIFFVGLLGVLASIVSLVYRIKTIQGTLVDSTYFAGVLLINNLVEMDVALIICSTPAFAHFMRAHVLDTRAFKYITFKLGYDRSETGMSYKLREPNQPRTGRENEQNWNNMARLNNRFKESDTWLFSRNATVNIEAQTSTSVGTDNTMLRGPNVAKTVDVERADSVSSQH